MQFSNFKIQESNNQKIFYTQYPLQNIKSIKYYKDNSNGSFSKKEFRWSFDGNYWSPWTVLNQGNISSINLTNSFFSLEIRYTPNNTASTVTTFILYYDGPEEKEYIDCQDTVVKKNTIYEEQNCIKSSDNPINANTLCSKNGEYYLWRPNHKGEQPISSITNLQKILNNLTYYINNQTVADAANINGSGIGVYYNRIDKTLYFKTLLEGNKIFISEDTTGHITLAVDDASISDLFYHLGNLNGVNLGVIDGSSGQIFKERIGDDFQFRSIVAGNQSVNITTLEDQVRISIDASLTGELWTDIEPVSADLGGINSGDILNNYTSIEVLEKLLYEYKPPIVNLYMEPSSGYYPKYDSGITDVSLYGNFNNTDFVKVRVYDISLYSSTMEGLEHIAYPDVSSGVFSFFDNTSFPNWENVVYNLKFYNKVNNTEMPIHDVSIDLKFVIPYIYGVIDNTIDVNNITPSILEGFYNNNQKIILPKDTHDVEFNRPGGIIKAKFIYAYDALYGELNSIFDIKNDFNITTSFDTSIINININGPSLTPYRFYIKSHWIDVTKFKLRFNI